MKEEKKSFHNVGENHSLDLSDVSKPQEPTLKNRFCILQNFVIIFYQNSEKLEMCQYDTDAPIQWPSPPAHRHFAKNEVEKGP